MFKMVTDYTTFTYDTESLKLLLAIKEDLQSRGFIFNKIIIEINQTDSINFINLSGVDFESFSTFASVASNSTIKGDSIAIIRSISLTVGNISNEFIPWNVDFLVDISKAFTLNIKESKKQDNLRQEKIQIHLNRYKEILFYFLDEYLLKAQQLIKTKELTSLKLNRKRYVDQFYVTDESGIDDSYVFP